MQNVKYKTDKVFEIIFWIMAPKHLPVEIHQWWWNQPWLNCDTIWSPLNIIALGGRHKALYGSNYGIIYINYDQISALVNKVKQADLEHSGAHFCGDKVFLNDTFCCWVFYFFGIPCFPRPWHGLILVLCCRNISDKFLSNIWHQIWANGGLIERYWSK